MLSSLIFLTPTYKMVWMVGFAPTAPRFQGEYSTRLSYTQMRLSLKTLVARLDYLLPTLKGISAVSLKIGLPAIERL